VLVDDVAVVVPPLPPPPQAFSVPQLSSAAVVQSSLAGRTCPRHGP
jgi:hypothetical protein